MSPIDLILLGMVLERPQSAYELQKDVAYHQLPRWTHISVPSVYRSVLRLQEQGYLQSRVVRGRKKADKAVYVITEAGKERFHELLRHFAVQSVPLQLDFNVVVTNLNKVSSKEACALVAQLRGSLCASMEESAVLAARYADIPPVGRAVFEQQARLYWALLAWLDDFEKQLAQE